MGRFVGIVERGNGTTEGEGGGGGGGVTCDCPFTFLKRCGNSRW